MVITSFPEKIDAVVFDFDGVFTDNRVIVFEDGREAVIVNRSDGWGISQLKKKYVELLVLSAEKNPVVAVRCNKLGISFLQGKKNKQAVLEAWLHDRNLDPRNSIYVGNDLNDLECMENIGCGITVADAHPELTQIAKINLKSCGGAGAVRELCDIILKKLEN